MISSFRETLHAWQYKALLLMQQFGRKADYVVNTISIVVAVLALGNVIWQIGFSFSADTAEWLNVANKGLIFIYALIQVYRLGSSLLQTRRATTWQIAYLVGLWAYLIYDVSDTTLAWLDYRYVIDAILVMAAAYDISTFGVSFLTRKSSPTMLFAGSFIFFIIIGTGLLLMPRCHYNDMTLLQSLFTATSAICVSGLGVLDVATEFTHFGQVVILVLIQIGGLGVMTFTCFFALTLSNKGSLHDSMVIKDIISADNISDIFSTLKHIMYVTFIIEGITAWFLFYFFRDAFPGSPTEDIVFFAVFHAISAFCNAGITNIEGGLMNPFIIDNNLLHLTLAIAIIFGGAGFPLQSAAISWVKTRIVILFKKLTGRSIALGDSHIRIINTTNRLTFYTHIGLLLLGTILFVIFEWNYSMDGKPFIDRVIGALFSSACARTAGFTIVDPLTCSGPSIVIFLLLMWIGCAPMSTGGGIKVTTFAICVLNLVNALKGRDSIEIFGRRISPQSVQKAFAVVVVSSLAVAASTIALKIVMPNETLIRLAFESMSALSTVGLSMDLTPELNAGGQLIIIMDMFIGRIGIMSFILMFVSPAKPQRYKYPIENITI